MLAQGPAAVLLPLPLKAPSLGCLLLTAAVWLGAAGEGQWAEAELLTSWGLCSSAGHGVVAKTPLTQNSGLQSCCYHVEGDCLLKQDCGEGAARAPLCAGGLATALHIHL